MFLFIENLVPQKIIDKLLAKDYSEINKGAFDRLWAMHKYLSKMKLGVEIPTFSFLDNLEEKNLRSSSFEYEKGVEIFQSDGVTIVKMVSGKVDTPPHEVVLKMFEKASFNKKEEDVLIPILISGIN